MVRYLKIYSVSNLFLLLVVLCSWEARFLYYIVVSLYSFTGISPPIRIYVGHQYIEAQSIQRESNGRTYIPIYNKGSKSANCHIVQSSTKHETQYWVLYNITWARWQSSYVLRRSRPSAHGSKKYKPIKCSISSVFSKIIKDYYDTSEYLTRLTAVRTFSTHFLP